VRMTPPPPTAFSFSPQNPAELRLTVRICVLTFSHALLVRLRIEAGRAVQCYRRDTALKCHRILHASHWFYWTRINEEEPIRPPQTLSFWSIWHSTLGVRRST